MADWVTISDTQVDPDAPITSELGYAFRDNPIAIAEGAVNAPRIRDNFGFATAADTASGMSFPLLGHNGVYGRFVFQLQNLANISRDLKVQFSTDGGSSWSAGGTIANLTTGSDPANVTLDINASINALNGSVRGVYNVTNQTLPPTASFTFNNNFTAAGFGPGVGHVRFFFTGGGPSSPGRCHFKRNGGEY